MKRITANEVDVKESKVEVSPRLATAIDKLNMALFAEFGLDHAYTIMGRGQVIAASNLKLGKVDAKIA